MQGGGKIPRELLQQLAIGGLRRYDGNLESVLDEHFWFVSATNSQSWPKRLSELRAALALTGGRTALHETTKKGKKSRVRCNVALPLHQSIDDDSDDAPRPDAYDTPSTRRSGRWC